MKSFTVFPNNIKNVPADRFLGRDTTGTGQCELLDAAALREIASLYSMAEVDSLIAAISSTAPGGSSGELQYNNGGAFGGASGLAWTPAASLNLTVTAQNAAHVPLCVKMASGQSAYAMLVQDSVGATKLYVHNDGSVYSNSTITAGYSVIAGGVGNLGWDGRSLMQSPSDGVIRLMNQANTDFNRLQLGGTTSSFPALKRSTTAVHVRLADDSAFTDLHGKELRAYDSAASKYVSLTHDGTDAYLTPTPSGSVVIPDGTVSDPALVFSGSSGLNTGIYKQAGGSGGPVFVVGGVEQLLINSTGNIRARSGATIGFSSGAPTAAVEDVALARNAARCIESNNGTAGVLGDFKARTFYGIAQASTDVAVSAQAHASQGSTSPILKVVNSAGSQLVGVLPDALQLGPAVTMKLSFDGPTNVSGANYIQSSYDTFRFRAYGGGGGDWGGNTLSLGSINDDATITNSTRGYGLKLVAIDGYGNANTAGTHITYCAGRGTGNATPGKHKFQTSTRVASGTTFQALSTGIEICDEGIGVYNREVKFYGPGGQSAHGSSMGTYVPHYSDAAVFTLCNGVMENLGPGGTNNPIYRNGLMGTMHFVNRQNVGALGTATLALGPGYFSPSGYLGDYTTPLSGTPGNGALVASSGKGTNIAGSNLKLAGGRPTGTGTPGTVDICTAPSVASGTTLGTYAVVGQFDASITATHTRFLLWDVDAGALKRVYVGAADSGGTGKKVLCVDN